jgi:exodeoxyribonuclease V alpha subunit
MATDQGTLDLEDKSVQFTGEVTRIFFTEPDRKEFHIFALRNESGASMKVKGNLAGLALGHHVTAFGKEEENKYGVTLNAALCNYATPKTTDALIEYLSSGMFKGVGRITAEKIVKHFRGRTSDIIENEPQRLIEVPDIGAKKTQVIISSIESRKGSTDFCAWMCMMGAGTQTSAKIARFFNVETLDQSKQAQATLRKNPYLLTRVQGIGFAKADEVASRLGIEKESGDRIDYGLNYVMKQISSEGHCGLERSLFIKRAVEILGVPSELVTQSIERSIASNDLQLAVENGEDILYSKALYSKELEIASHLNTLAALEGAFATTSEEELRCLAQRVQLTSQTGESFHLEGDQLEAVVKLLPKQVGVLTGGPGMGKTTIIKALIELYGKKGLSIKMAAPTGKAAKRAMESVKIPVTTIHRLLDYGPSKENDVPHFKVNAENPLEADVLIIDESSMLDVTLTHSMIAALTQKTHLILVGDVDQLPSVGAGKVLKDIIESGCVCVARLTQTRRQGKQSNIPIAAQKVNNGFSLPNYISKSLEVHLVDDEEQGLELLKSSVTSALESFKPGEIQVLAPQKRGILGTENLNTVVKALLNPDALPAGIRIGEAEVCIGDRLIQNRNNYKKEIFNGDIGFMAEHDSEEHVWKVTFASQDEVKTVDFEAVDMDELSLGFALTIHRFQGSETPCVIVPLFNSHYMMLKRNLLYTAITRARTKLILIAQKKAMDKAVSTLDDRKRITSLMNHLIRTAEPSVF